ncbi:hypothetical protein DVG79_15405 [Exiguobacterium sp. RIT594]|nr:hypothetical protein DVG79_15405 [Exiguobacterium sp. RIT594]
MIVFPLFPLAILLLLIFDSFTSRNVDIVFLVYAPLLIINALLPKRIQKHLEFKNKIIAVTLTLISIFSVIFVLSYFVKNE